MDEKQERKPENSGKVLRSRVRYVNFVRKHRKRQMSELVQIVDSLEDKVSSLLHRMEMMRQANDKLEEEVARLTGEKQALVETIQDWEEKYKALKLANSMLGSDTNKTEAKLKINSLIRELDHCIVQLSE